MEGKKITHFSFDTWSPANFFSIDNRVPSKRNKSVTLANKAHTCSLMVKQFCPENVQETESSTRLWQSQDSFCRGRREKRGGWSVRRGGDIWKTDEDAPPVIIKHHHNNKTDKDSTPLWAKDRPSPKWTWCFEAFPHNAPLLILILDGQRTCDEVTLRCGGCGGGLMPAYSKTQ